MFATLLGGLPSPSPTDAAGIDDRIALAIRAQVEAGLEPVTDGRLGDPDFERLGRLLLDRGHGSDRDVDTGGRVGSMTTVLERWRRTAEMTDRAVKQALPGPYTLGRRLDPRMSRERLTIDLAEALRREVDALSEAGCALVEIEEADAHLIGGDEAERALFRDAHRRLADGVGATHLSLSIVGGAVDKAGIATILDAPYASLAVDLIAGPDNWNLVVQAPRDRGVVAGVLSGRETADEAKEVMLWAAHYAASGGRGLARVGLGSAGSYASLTWEAALRKMRRLGEAARLASLPPGEELVRSLDPAAVSARRAALGRDAPPRPRRAP